MLMFVAYSLAGKMEASFEAQKYNFPDVYVPLISIFVPSSVDAYGSRLTLGYYFTEGMGLYAALGTGYSITHDSLTYYYEGSYYTSTDYANYRRTLFPFEFGIGLSFVPYRGRNALLKVRPEFNFLHLSGKDMEKDSSVTHYTSPDTTIISVSDTSYTISSNVLSLPINFSAEYFVSSGASIGVEYGLYLFRIGKTTRSLENGSQSSVRDVKHFLTPANRLKVKVVFYF